MSTQENDRIRTSIKDSVANELADLARRVNRDRKWNIFRAVVLYLSVSIAALLIYAGASGRGMLDILFTYQYYIFGYIVFILGLTFFSLSAKKTDTDFVDVDSRRRASRALNPAAAWPFPTGSRPFVSDDEWEEKYEHEHEHEHMYGYEHDDDDEDEDEDEDEEQETDENSVDYSNLGDNDEGNRATSPKNAAGVMSKQRSSSTPSDDILALHFYQITEILTQRAADADEKASLLLSKGTDYTKAGIGFFIVSIIGWQVLAATRGFHDFYIYGIVSCTGLFIFIEFLSAWFLKQYRQYVDTATYLLKVKSIFDRYILLYFAHHSFSDSSYDSRLAAAEGFIRVLEKDIVWPESYLLKKESNGFADEATNAIGMLAKELRKSRQEKKSTKTKRPPEGEKKPTDGK